MNDNKIQPMLWWVWDSENDSFSTLPTGPFLVPSLIIGVILLVARRLLIKQVTIESIAGPLTEDPLWIEKRKRYQYLIEKSINNGQLEVDEIKEFYDLQHYMYNPYGRHT